MGQPGAMLAMYKFHHGFYHVTMRTMRTPSFSLGRAGKSVQQLFPFHVVVKGKSVLVWLQACVLIIIFSPGQCWWDLILVLLNSVGQNSEGAMEFK